MRILCAVFLLLTAGAALAQSPWQGEWGAFPNGDTKVGQRLSIHDCHESSCKFSIVNRSVAGQAGSASDQVLTLESATEASAKMTGETETSFCALHFARTAAPQAAITVQATGRPCSAYYGTGPLTTMSGTYPFRSATNYVGTHAEECFSDTSKALLALCTVLELHTLEEKWESLAERYPLQPLAKDESSYNASIRVNNGIVHACDASANPEPCLAARYSADIATMQARQNAYLDGTAPRGDVAEGGRLAAKIAGKYRDRFENGDVQGHSYKTTDTLDIRPVGAASIHFDIELNFFNGHTCSISGGALYRKDGSFVFDDISKNDFAGDGNLCRLALIPTDTGVRMKDITGGCKNYCGERGSLDGAAFKFTQRIAGTGQAGMAKPK